jgi:hypothetical protein
MKPEITDTPYNTALTFKLVTHYGFLPRGKESIYQTDMNAESALLSFLYKLSEHITAPLLRLYRREVMTVLRLAM